MKIDQANRINPRQPGTPKPPALAKKPRASIKNLNDYLSPLKSLRPNPRLSRSKAPLPRELTHPEMPMIPDLSKMANQTITPADPVKTLGVDKVREEYDLTGKGVGVAFIDSGYDHPDCELAAWKDIRGESETPVDKFGHGTFVAGNLKTIAPGVNLIGVRTMNDRGVADVINSVRGINWVVKHKDDYNIKILNLSSGGGFDPVYHTDLLLQQAVTSAIRAGITVVGVADNHGPNKATISVPGNNPAVITVGSLKDENTVSDFSGRGAVQIGLKKPDVMAPGEFILSWAAPDSKILKEARQADKIRTMNGSEIRDFLRKNPGFLEEKNVPRWILSLEAPVLKETADLNLEKERAELDQLLSLEPGQLQYILARQSSNPEIMQMDAITFRKKIVNPIRIESRKLDGLQNMTGEQLRKHFTSHPESLQQRNLSDWLLSMDDQTLESTVKSGISYDFSSYRDGMLMLPGTSFAAPLVSGVIALMYQANRDLTPEQVQVILTATAKDVGDYFSPDDIGAGMADAKAAVDLALKFKKTD